MANLLKNTQKMLANRKESLALVAEKSGVSYHWLVKLNQGKHDPRVTPLQKLYDYLSEDVS